ncbi:MAG: GNAT family N-acetyltransferase [Bacilli bacterium]|nr:GNAT family N-acetyltransferase [Bacilli bacterium]
MNKINEIMNILDTINYGFIDDNGTNIFNNDLNVEYIFNQVYHLMSPEELLKKKYGVCWDQVELERKLFSETNIPFKTYFIYTDDQNYLPSHTFLVYEENDKYYWFEHSWYDEKGIHEYNSLNELLNEIVDKHEKAHGDEIKDNYGTTIYEYNKPNYNINCDEFYEFIYKQKRVYNYILEDSTEEDIDRLKYYKLKSIVDYAENLSEDEMSKIDSYIQSNIPKQLKDYKNIKHNNKVIGCLLVSTEDNEILLDEIYLEKKYRKKGIGSNIIKTIIKESTKDIILWLYKKNVNAYNLYLKLGFKILNETDTRYKMIIRTK